MHLRLGTDFNVMDAAERTTGNQRARRNMDAPCRAKIDEETDCSKDAVIHRR